jgi:hypothetical protein
MNKNLNVKKGRKPKDKTVNFQFVIRGTDICVACINPDRLGLHEILGLLELGKRHVLNQLTVKEEAP